mmetsp:Transcript_16358/g.45676  ORF Transcript_16358/g.45676 Transcript_16358/m.45676 type:complete len:231 (-) Transcript_16358:280-972(-)
MHHLRGQGGTFRFGCQAHRRWAMDIPRCRMASPGENPSQLTHVANIFLGFSSTILVPLKHNPPPSNRPTLRGTFSVATEASAWSASDSSSPRRYLTTKPKCLSASAAPTSCGNAICARGRPYRCAMRPTRVSIDNPPGTFSRMAPKRFMPFGRRVGTPEAARWCNSSRSISQNRGVSRRRRYTPAMFVGRRCALSSLSSTGSPEAASASAARTKARRAGSTKSSSCAAKS